MPVPSRHRLQVFRNKYAAKKLEEQKALEEAERKRQAKENEKAEYRNLTSLCQLQKYYTRYFEEKAVELENLFRRAHAR